LTFIHPQSSNFGSLREQFIKKVGEIAFRMEILEQDANFRPSSQKHLDVVSPRSEKEIKEPISKEVKI